MSEMFQAHPAGETPCVTPVFPQRLPRSEHCELPLNIAVFFDGTGNNQNWDEHDACNAGLGMSQQAYGKDSNVARLFRAYPDKSALGYYRLYVEGVGTPCKPIGEDTAATFGMGFGEGAEGRIIRGLLFMLNAIYYAITVQDRFSAETIKALCRNGRRQLTTAGTLTSLKGGVDDVKALMPVGMNEVGGLLGDALGNRDHARRFLREQAQAIAALVTKPGIKPQLVSIAIDVFGFSRGGAQARVFCSWLAELLENDCLCGVPVTLRFLGIFDTVASVGVANNTLPYNLSNGHSAWAQPEALRISPKLKQCVHYVAMHENRASFPLESARGPDGHLPPNCVQYLLPGMHSDVGGGYGPNAQGRCPSGDRSDRLSQIPLELMYNAARAAQVPLDRTNAKDGTFDPFAVHPNLRTAYNNFIAAVPRSGTIAQYLLDYLAWRYQVREVYASKLSWLARAVTQDREDLAGANGTLMADIEALDATDTMWSQAWRSALQTNPLIDRVMNKKGRDARKLAADARDLLANLRAYRVLGTPENPEHLTPQAFLFANYVHDSYAGFKPFDTKFAFVGCTAFLPGHWEPEGYLRYRRFYTGTDHPQTASLPAPATPVTQPSEEELQRQNVQRIVDMHGMQF